MARDKELQAMHANLLVNPQDRKNADFERRILELEDKVAKLSVALDELGRRQDEDYQVLKAKIGEYEGD